MNKEVLEKKIISLSRIIHNFPKDGVNFIDLSMIFETTDLYKEIIDYYASVIPDSDKILGIQSRGFLLSAPLSLKTNIPLILARKAGKVAFKPIREEYGLEYGKDALEISEVQIKKGEKIAIVDDILATGGTLEAAIKLVNRLGGIPTSLIVLGNLPNLLHDKLLSKYNIPLISLAKFTF
jgi:adenine phosphoribosyltransferase